MWGRGSILPFNLIRLDLGPWDTTVTLAWDRVVDTLIARKDEENGVAI